MLERNPGSRDLNRFIMMSMLMMLGGLQIRKVREYQGGAFVSPLFLAARGGHLAVCKVVRRDVEGRSCFDYFGKIDLTEIFTKERMVLNMKTNT